MERKSRMNAAEASCLSLINGSLATIVLLTDRLLHH